MGPMPRARARTLLLAALSGAALPASALAQGAPPPARAEASGGGALSPVIVTGRRQSSRPAAAASPTVETVTAQDLQTTVNVFNTEDALRYLPSLLVRKRHIGDTQAPLATRTNGVGASARSLIYADGVLLSALIGNNNSTASPRWGMVSPEEIARVDVLYGPFSAAYPGNAIGGVVQFVTRTPERLEGSVHVAGDWQTYRQYGVKNDVGAQQLSGTVGDRFGPLSIFAGLNHVHSKSQPLSYVTATRPAAPGAAGTPVTGAIADLNRAGAPIAILGAGGLEDQTQDNAKFKLALDVGDGVRLSYGAGLFANDTQSDVQTFLRNSAGTPVYSGSPNIAGYPYTVAASAFSNSIYRFRETHWMHSLQAASREGGTFEWQAAASLYDYAKDEQRNPTGALPGGASGGPGAIVRLDGTGWANGDLKATWRPEGSDGDHAVSFGLHGDRYTLRSARYNTDNWIGGDPQSTASSSRGRTRTLALWAQDAWRLTPALTLTIGARYEDWRAYGGANYSAAPLLAVVQPAQDARRLSPKAALSWRPAERWTVTASYGDAYRFPTVTELYQTVTTGLTLTVPDPNLRPEHARSAELAIERAFTGGRVRLSLFSEDVTDALLSQTAPLVPGSTTLFSYVQNIDRTRARGAELVVERSDVLIRSLDISGSVTYADPVIAKDRAFPAALGKQLPGVPRWKAAATATWRAGDRLALTLAGRYSDRVYATIDNSDPVTHTYQGFDGFLVIDARATYRITPRWTAAVGIDNLNGRNYFLFHPFPQRAATAELSYRY